MQLLPLFPLLLLIIILNLPCAVLLTFPPIFWSCAYTAMIHVLFKSQGQKATGSSFCATVWPWYGPHLDLFWSYFSQSGVYSAAYGRELSWMSVATKAVKTKDAAKGPLSPLPLFFFFMFLDPLQLYFDWVMQGHDMRMVDLRQHVWPHLYLYYSFLTEEGPLKAITNFLDHVVICIHLQMLPTCLVDLSLKLHVKNVVKVTSDS